MLLTLPLAAAECSSSFKNGITDLHSLKILKSVSEVTLSLADKEVAGKQISTASFSPVSLDGLGDDVACNANTTPTQRQHNANTTPTQHNANTTQHNTTQHNTGLGDDVACNANDTKAYVFKMKMKVGDAAQFIVYTEGDNMGSWQIRWCVRAKVYSFAYNKTQYLTYLIIHVLLQGGQGYMSRKRKISQ